MEVDSPPAAAATGVAPGNNNNDDGEANVQHSKKNKQMQEKTIKMHPLALIGISDHSTRVISGGSAQPSNSVIMGLLFGYQNHRTISIIDAEEVEYNHNKEHVDTKIELHQKVFPSHEVVGWYRVFRTGSGAGGEGMDATEEEKEEMGLPTPDDMMIQNGWMKEYNESPIFVLMSSGEMEVEEDEAVTKTSQTTNEASKSTSMDIDEDVDERDARDKMDRDEQLPLSIYETLVLAEQPPTNEQSSQPQQAARIGAIFVNLEFELETFEPERIAVEKVFKTQPTTSTTVVSMPNTTTTTLNTPTITEDEHAQKMGPAPLPPSNTEEEDNNNNPPPSASVLHIQSLQSSIEAMNARIAVLLEFLRKTQTGKLPPDHALLRQVGSLVHQLPFVMGRGDIAANTEGGSSSSSSSRKMRDGWRAEELEDGYEDMLLLSFLASVAKTTKAVLNYSDKFRVVNDSASKNNSRRSSRESFNLRKVL